MVWWCVAFLRTRDPAQYHGAKVWRCIVVYRGARHLHGPVVFIPGLAYLGSIGKGYCYMAQNIPLTFL